MNLTLLTGCAGGNQSSQTAGGPIRLTQWLVEWKSNVGHTVVLEGKPVNLKLGAALENSERLIWIDGLAAWPENIRAAGERGKSVQVSGVVIVRHDLPAFVMKPGELVRSGIPVASEAELEAAKTRYLVADASWRLVD